MDAVIAHGTGRERRVAYQHRIQCSVPKNCLLIGLEYNVKKRVLNIACAVCALIILSPLMLLLSIVIGVSMGHPIIFKSTRIGLSGQEFAMYKFRTMTGRTDADGVLLPDEQRLTSLGRFLRRTSLDELPEFWNILKGDMSLVGPRPLLPEYLPLYDKRQARRHDVRPGLTGLAQTNGRNATSWSTRLELDVQYVESGGLISDTKILLRTVKLVLRRDGIAHPGEATMPKFTGIEDD